MSGLAFPKPGRRRRPGLWTTKDGRLVARTWSAWDVRRRMVWVRAGKCCECCGCGLADAAEAHVHHKTPRRMGGGSRSDALENLEALCRACHLGRHGGRRCAHGDAA